MVSPLFPLFPLSLSLSLAIHFRSSSGILHLLHACMQSAKRPGFEKKRCIAKKKERTKERASLKNPPGSMSPRPCSKAKEKQSSVVGVFISDHIMLFCTKHLTLRHPNGATVQKIPKGI
ncbi:hypothetical protein AA313_de0205212 [Arthrobotrys entomopaga]|nr:hypothetical protein AA313_de0205212 [Arthrobotrys entomopaga]